MVDAGRIGRKSGKGSMIMIRQRPKLELFYYIITSYFGWKLEQLIATTGQIASFTGLKPILIVLSIKS
jgi:hypothetical protein